MDKPELSRLLTEELRARTTLHAALLQEIDRLEAVNMRLRAKQACAKCDAIATARALCGVETVTLP